MKDIPVYSIDKFNNKAEQKIQFQVELFDSNRNFKVSYPHRHDDFYELLFITQGQGTHTIDFKQYAVQPFDIFFLSPGQIHELSLSNDIQGYIFLFSSSFYHFNKTDSYKLFELPFFYNLSQKTPPLSLDDAQKQVFISLFEQAVSENKQQLPDSEEVIRALLDIILIQCKRIYPVNTPNDISNKGRVLVKRFKQLIETKCQENLSVKAYASLLAITPNHLSETVKAVTGRNPTDFINDRMILEIKRYLAHTELSVSEIAFQLNFADQSYFSKYFKKLSQQSPLEFRNKG